MKFKKIAVGGTFDYLHDGHVAILSKAFESGELVVIGIVSDEMGQEKDLTGIEPMAVRRKKLLEFLKSRGWSDRAEIYSISDPLGPAALDGELEAIVVSEESRPGAELINEARGGRGLDPLEIVQIPWVLAEDGTPISSIRVRYGEIDTRGKVKRAKGDISDSG